MDPSNPLGIHSIDHLEFTTNSLNSPYIDTFKQMGFSNSSSHSVKKQKLFDQGQVRFLVVADQDESSHSAQYFKNHGEGVSKISFRVENVQAALEEAVKRGATLRQDVQKVENENGVFETAAIQGIGDIWNEFVSRPNTQFRPDFVPSDSNKENALTTRVARIDHLTNNVPFGKMEEIVDYYKTVFGFVETRYFDIKGKQTGLHSKVVQLKNGNVIIPINEPSSEESKSQIQEYLDLHKGSGVQHIALTTPNIISTVGQLREREIKFLDVPDTYYQDLPNRGFTVTENIEDLQKLSLLADGDKEGYLLQIFTKTYIGPLFFEYIQRKNHFGFGEGNFQALFDAIEKDQKQRGYL
jgi:4-hydroxyphenylpyruvate dioxygenase